MKDEKLTFYTKLSMDECINRIKQNPKNVEFSNRYVTLFDADKELFYKIEKDSIRLEKAIISQNAYKPIFYGEFVKSSKGTILSGEFKRSSLSKVIYAIVLPIYLLMLVGGIVLSFTTPSDLFNQSMFFIAMLFFFIVGFGNHKLMEIQAKIYEEQTIGFVEKTIEAKIQNEALKVGTK